MTFPSVYNILTHFKNGNYKIKIDFYYEITKELSPVKFVLCLQHVICNCKNLKYQTLGL